MLDRFKSLVLLRRIDRTTERIAVALERIATAAERGKVEENTFRSNYNDQAGSPAAIFSLQDDLITEITEREAKLGRSLDQDELEEIFRGSSGD